jgi:O-methyltransferase
MLSIALTLQSALPYDHQEAIEAAAGVVREFTMVPFTGLATNYLLVRHLDDTEIEGAIVECGVWRGGSAGMMAIAHQVRGAPRRSFELFDSFCDMPPPDEAVDGERAIEMAHKWGGASRPLAGDTTPMTGFFEEAGFGGAGQPGVVHRLLETIIGLAPEEVHVHEGWVQDTLPATDTGPIALLRLDVDWHAATLVCLDNLYDRVVTGGFVVIDDYGTFDGCRTTVDSYLEARGERPFLHHIDGDRRYFVKP